MKCLLGVPQAVAGDARELVVALDDSQRGSSRGSVGVTAATTASCSFRPRQFALGVPKGLDGVGCEAGASVAQVGALDRVQVVG